MYEKISQCIIKKRSSPKMECLPGSSLAVVLVNEDKNSHDPTLLLMLFVLF